MLNLTVFHQTETPVAHDRPRPERLVRGNPLRSTWTHYAVDGVDSGLWSCEIGAWNIAFDDGKDEFFHVISGRIRITNADGLAAEFGPGQACIIPGGFRGTFEVLEPVTKHYVIVDRGTIRR